jgi:hypothetical protein
MQSTTFIHIAASLPASDMAIAGTTLYLSQSVFLLIGIQLATTMLHTRLTVGLDTALDRYTDKNEASFRLNDHLGRC